MMSSVRAATLLAALGGASAAACDGKCMFLSDGLYCPVNDVREHADINKDVAAIATFLKEDPPDYAAAKTVYQEGLESSKGGGIKRTLQGLAQKDMTANGYTNVFFSGAVDLYGSIDNVWHKWIMACLDHTGECAGKSNDFRNYIINKGLIGAVTAYVTYEMGAAIKKAADGLTTDTGAPFNWDEGAAFHIGRKELADLYVIGEDRAPGSLYSPWEFNWKRDADYPDGVMTHEHAMRIFNQGLLNLRGTYNSGAVAAAQEGMYKIYAITAIRSAIKYGWKAYNGGTMEPKYLAEGAMYWRSASGYLSTFNRTVVEQVDAIFALDKMSFSKEEACMVKTHVESLYEAAGISCTEVGTWKDAEDCLATACTPAGADTLSDGDANYVEGCVPNSDMDTQSDSATAAGLTSASLVAAIYLLL